MEPLRLYGEPPYAVVVIHGGPGVPGTMAPVARELSTECGLLEPLQTAASIDGQLSELRAAIDRHGDPPVALVGSSWGAMLGFLFASRFPQLVSRLIMIGSAVFEEQYAREIMPTRFNRLDERERLEAERLLAALQDDHTADNDSIFAALGALMTKADMFDPLTLDTEAVEVQYTVYRAVWEEAVALRRSARLVELGRQIACPVRAIHGDHDPHPAPGIRQPLERVLADFRFIPLANCGHYPWLERQARSEFFAILRKEVPARRSLSPAAP